MDLVIENVGRRSETWSERGAPTDDDMVLTLWFASPAEGLPSVPVLASAVGGIRYTVSDGHSGVLMQGWDPGDYADAAISILSDPVEHERLRSGAVVMSQRFSWDATADRLLELYDGITA